MNGIAHTRRVDVDLPFCKITTDVKLLNLSAMIKACWEKIFKKAMEILKDRC